MRVIVPPMNDRLMEVMFLKALVLSAWAGFQEAREAKLYKIAWERLVRLFQQEWDRRRAKQPLQLTYRPRSLGGTESGGPVE